MKSSYFSWILGAMIFIFLGQRDFSAGSEKIEGVVLAEATGKPLPFAHVYIVHGEEEALTNNKGEFSISTSSGFPVTVTAEHDGYQTYRWKIGGPGKKQTVSLRSK